MNENQIKAVEILNKKFSKGEITLNNYRQSLDVCLAALEEPEQASESKQVDLKELQFYFVDAYSEKAKQVGSDMQYYINTGQLIAVKKDKELSGLKPGFITFDEMHNHIQPGGVFDKFKNLVQVKKNKKDEAVHVPADAIVKPTVQGEIKFGRLEGAKFIREPDEKDEYAEIAARLNEIADKVNSLYPLVKRIDTDSYIIKSGLGLKGVKPGETKQANVNKTLDDYPLTERQLKQVADYVNVNLKINSDTNINDLVKQLKDEIAKDLKETRLKGKLY